MTQRILTCNAGSNSLKCALFDNKSLAPAYHFEADRIHDEATGTLKDASGEMILEEKLSEQGYRSALSHLLDWYQDNEENASIVAAGHRIVHGGKMFEKPVKVDDEVKQALEKLTPLAPLHQPYNLALIDDVAEALPNIHQVMCFDTAFHRTQPAKAQQFALPHEFTEEGILRYGFHGLSYEYIAQILPDHIGTLSGKRVIVAHLGGGASMCALQDGKSIATTMGFTALDGLMMGTRCGNLDPGVVLYLLKEKGMSADEVEKLLYKQSGLLGVSDMSGDMRDLDGKENPQAKQAIELFCYMAARQLGGLMTVMGGLDALVFTGAMGCDDFFVRAQICDYLHWMQLRLDEVANAKHHTIISTESSPITVLTLPTDEECIIAQQTTETLNPNGGD